MDQEPPFRTVTNSRDGIPDDGAVVDWANPICGECSGPRSPNSGSICRACYRRLAAAKKARTEEGVIYQYLRDGERKGRFVLTPQGWTLPEYAKRIDWSKE